MKELKIQYLKVEYVNKIYRGWYNLLLLEFLTNFFFIFLIIIFYYNKPLFFIYLFFNKN